MAGVWPRPCHPHEHDQVLPILKLVINHQSSGQHNAIDDDRLPRHPCAGTGAAAPKHTHPGEEIAYVLEGELVLEVEGKQPMKLKAGDTFFIPAGQVHTGKNPGKNPAVVLSTYILEKAKPLATMVK